MSATNPSLPEIQAPGVPNPTEQGLINNGASDIFAIEIGAVLALFAERQEIVPMSVKAGAVAILKEKAEEALHNAHIDSLTGFKDEKSFWADMESYANRLDGDVPGKRSVVLLLTDISGLKRLNDNRGRIAGDKLLRESAEALDESTRPDDVCYRLGKASDEYAVILHGVNPESVGIIIENLTKAVDKRLKEKELPVEELRLGILIAGGALTRGMKPIELFEQVDAELSEKKRISKDKLPNHLKHDDRL